MTATVPLREFNDSKGTRWTVWATTPDSRGGVASAFLGGWLTFESGGVLRRLMPIPDDWEEAPQSRLEEYCGIAQRVATRKLGPRDADADADAETRD